MAPAIEDNEGTNTATEATAPAAPPKKGRKKAADKTPAAPKAGGRPARITDSVVLKVGEGESLVKRPKYKAIVAAFAGDEGKTVADGLKAAADELGPKLKSANFIADPIGYLRGYLGELLACKALVAVSTGTEGEAAPEAVPAEEAPVEA